MRLFRSLALAGLWLTPLALSAQIPHVTTPVMPPPPVPPPRAPEEMIDSLRLRDAPLDLVLDRLEAWTGRTILRPQALPAATVTLNITRPMPKSEAIQAVISVLNLNNIGVVEMGDKFLKIVELANKTRTEAPMMITGSALDFPASGKVASKIFELNYLKATDIVPQLNTTLNVQLGGAVFFTNTNAFLVTDSISNLQRVEQLLLALDQPATPNFTPKFYSLHFAKASDLVTKIKLMLQGPSQITFGNSVTLSPDDRTNQIVLIADPKQYPFYDQLIDKLDVKADPNTRNEVIYLKHATSKDVATLLGTVITGQNAALAKAATGSGSTRPGQTVQPPGNNAAPNTAPNSAGFNNAANSSTTEFSSLLTVASDDRSNAIVVSGTVDDIRLIQELVDKIDVILAQVRIEVIIAEVTLTDTDASGISALNLTVSGGNIAKTGFGMTGATDLGTGANSWTVTNGAVSPLAFNAAFNSQGVKNKLHVLSAPTIVTTHNKPAEIKVGQKQPIITGSTSTPNTTGSGLTTNSTVTYQDIAIDLKVTPLIGDDGNIQLDINQEVNDIIGNVTVDGNSQPIIGTRVATSFINVQDGQMVVLGGLQRTKKENDKTKIGWLYEWPIISWLFGARSHSDVRSELLLFIRPHILPPETGAASTQKEIDRLQDKENINAYLKATDPNAPAPVPVPEKSAKAPAPAPRRSR